MKTTKILTYIFTGSMFLVLNTSCKKLADFGDTNVNPNGSTYGETGTFISTIESRLGSRTYGTGDAAAEITAGLFGQYFAEPTYPGLSRYTLPQIEATGFYSGILFDCKKVIDRNTDPALRPAASSSGSNESQLAMTRIMKAYVYWTITDRWGDMPYSDALQGVGNLTPKYDTQESIYTDLLKELTEAVDQFDPAGVKVKGDLIYGGDILKWQKFDNSLRMLISMRLTKRYPLAGQYAAQQFSAAVSHPAGFFTSNADNFQLNYPGNTLIFNNPWFASGNSADNGVAQTFTDALSSLADTRINSFTSNSTTGVPYGLGVAASTSVTYAKILASTYKQASGTVVFVNAASVLLAQAEAIERGWVVDPLGEQYYYNAGVTASFAQWGQTVPSSYLTSGPANFNTGAGVASIGGSSVGTVANPSNALTPSKLARINLQQWIAFYPNGIQGWANWRRTGVPGLQPSNFPATSHTAIPRRYVYGTNDYSSNADQVNLAATAMGGDTQDTYMWWDKP